MNTPVISIDIPTSSKINGFLHGADFSDCHAMNIPPTTDSALTLYLRTVSLTPAWINNLMALRNRLVRLVGLKNLGHLGDTARNKPAADYRTGDRVGIFTLLYLSDQEVILGDNDRHLEVRVSVQKRPNGEHEQVAMATVVHNHNWLGRFYMLFVAPLHRLIVPATLRTLAKAQASARPSS